MNRKLFHIALLLFVMSDCFAQDDFTKAFSSFAAESQQKYEDFSKSANQDFIKALTENWKSFKVFDAKVRPPRRPEPDSLSVSCPESNVQIDVSDVPVAYVGKKSSSKAADAAGFFGLNYEPKFGDLEVSLDFYGRRVGCRIPSRFGALRLNGSSERSVSSFWSSMCEAGVEQLKAGISKTRTDLNLNDWALFEWTVMLSNSVFPGECGNERAVFTVFCMNQMGFCCKIARSVSGLLPLFASEQEIYGRKFVLMDGVKYYLPDGNEAATSLSSYSVDMKGAENRLDMNLFLRPEIGTGNGMLSSLNSSVMGKTLTLPVNESIISFYNDYPQLDVNIYAAAEPDCNFSDAIISYFNSTLERPGGVEAVNTLLAFLQKDFSYRTDIDQFGKEKPFFFEENFVYPYNDCEDRAVLFSFFARKLLRYDCILLEYSDHVNCALDIGEDIPQGYYVRRGERKYYICDPTCTGARIGMSGKDHQTKPQKIWVL